MSEKILIVGPSWVGDMVMAQVLFKLLMQQDSKREIDVLALPWSKPLLDRMPEVRRSVDMPVGHGKLMLSERYHLGKALAEEKYDHAILLPNSLKSALIPWFAGIAKRTGWRGEMRYGLLNDIRLLNKATYPLMIERFAALAFPAGQDLPDLPWPALTVNPQSIPPLLDKFGLNTDRPVLALCPGAEFGPAKRWPEYHYAAVAKAAIAGGWQVWLMGSEKDKSVAADIVKAIDEQEREHITALAGITKLAEAIDLLSQATAVVSNDSGLMHIAAALGRPLVVVYGSTSPKFTPPLADNVAILSLQMDCRPCFKRECPLQHLDCLKKLQPQQVLESLNRLTAPAIPVAEIH